MFEYHVKVVKGRKETVYPCSGYTVTVRPEGTDSKYNDHPEIVGLPPIGFFDGKPNPDNTPEGQVVKLELNGPDGPGNPIVYLPRDGKVAYIMNSKGDTIDTYPRKPRRQNGTE